MNTSFSNWIGDDDSGGERDSLASISSKLSKLSLDGGRKLSWKGSSLVAPPSPLIGLEMSIAREPRVLSISVFKLSVGEGGSLSRKSLLDVPELLKLYDLRARRLAFGVSNPTIPMDMRGLRDELSHSSTGARDDEQDPMEEVDEFAFRVFDVLAVRDLESRLVTSVNEVSGQEDTLDVARLTNGEVDDEVNDGGAEEKK